MGLAADIEQMYTDVASFQATLPGWTTIPRALDKVWCIDERDPLDGCSPCFLLKHSDSCDAFYLFDHSEWPTFPIALQLIVQGVPNLWGINLESVGYSVDYKGNCDKEFCNIQPTTFIQQNQQTTISASKGDGVYRVNVEVTFKLNCDALPDEIEYITRVYSHEIEICCCADLCCDLQEKVECKLGSISCKINEHEKIGRETTKLYFDMYRLLNILWVLQNFTLDCLCLQQLKCGYDKIKNC